MSRNTKPNTNPATTARRIHFRCLKLSRINLSIGKTTFRESREIWPKLQKKRRSLPIPEPRRQRRRSLLHSAAPFNGEETKFINVHRLVPDLDRAPQTDRAGRVASAPRLRRVVVLARAERQPEEQRRERGQRCTSGAQLAR